MCVCVCVCICSVTSGVSVHPENTVIYSVGNAGLVFSLKLLCCRDTLLLALYGYPCSWPFWKPHMRIINSACVFKDSRMRLCFTCLINPPPLYTYFETMRLISLICYQGRFREHMKKLELQTLVDTIHVYALYM